MLARVSGGYGIDTRNPSVLVPMPCSSALRPSDFTGDASRFGKRIQRERSRIRVKGKAVPAFAASVPSISDSNVWDPNREKRERIDLLAKLHAADQINLSEFDPRTQRRIRAAASRL